MGVSPDRIRHAMEKMDELLPGWREQVPELWIARRGRIPTNRRPGLVRVLFDLKEVFETYSRDGLTLPWVSVRPTRAPKHITPKPKAKAKKTRRKRKSRAKEKE